MLLLYCLGLCILLSSPLVGVVDRSRKGLLLGLKGLLLEAAKLREEWLQFHLSPSRFLLRLEEDVDEVSSREQCGGGRIASVGTVIY